MHYYILCKLWSARASYFKESKLLLFFWCWQQRSWHPALSPNRVLFFSYTSVSVWRGFCIPTAASVVWSLAFWEGVSPVSTTFPLADNSANQTPDSCLVFFFQRTIRLCEKSIARTICQRETRDCFRSRLFRQTQSRREMQTAAGQRGEYPSNRVKEEKTVSLYITLIMLENTAGFLVELRELGGFESLILSLAALSALTLTVSMQTVW